MGLEVFSDEGRIGKFENLYKGHTDEITYLLFDPKNFTLMSASLDGTMTLWGYGKILPVNFKYRAYLKLLITDM